MLKINEARTMREYRQAMAWLPKAAKWSSSFGNCGEGGYVEFYRTPDGQRFTVSNGPYNATKPFHWTAKNVTEAAATIVTTDWRSTEEGLRASVLAGFLMGHPFVPMWARTAPFHKLADAARRAEIAYLNRAKVAA